VFSPQLASQVPSPQKQFGPQSCGQKKGSSKHSGWHWPLPHTQVEPQSAEQVCAVSPQAA
jgi:hypothetical protein